MELLRKQFLTLLNNTPDRFRRELPINWENRMIAITGARGVGKTTYVLQQIQRHHTSLDQVLYLSLDNFYFYKHSLLEVVDTFYSYGGRFLYLDEVHKYEHWSRVLKNLYDQYPRLQVVFTSSSILDIYQGEADLSRRAIKVAMPGLSFREYLFLHKGIQFSSYTLPELLSQQTEILQALPKGFQPLPAFREYLISGYYPFSLEPDFLLKLHNALNLVIESDLGKIEQLSQHRIEQIKRILGVIAESVPFKPNISALSQKLGIARDILLTSIYQLEKACILNLLQAPNKGVSAFQKPQKIFLENANLMYALRDQPDRGNLRETFFFNQLKNSHHRIFSSPQADFWVDEQYTFEIGGKHKDAKQLAGVEHAYLVKDDIEVGGGRVVPLWMFGGLY